jgi:hypothetical protein
MVCSQPERHHICCLIQRCWCCVCRQGRATFYGNEPWYWSIHHGSECLLMRISGLLQLPAMPND